MFLTRMVWPPAPPPAAPRVPPSAIDRSPPLQRAHSSSSRRRCANERQFTTPLSLNSGERMGQEKRSWIGGGGLRERGFRRGDRSRDSGGLGELKLRGECAASLFLCVLDKGDERDDQSSFCL
jgi:hypothetical protein